MKHIKPMTKEELDKMIAELKKMELDGTQLPPVDHKNHKLNEKVNIINPPQKKVRKGTQKGA